MTSERQSVGLAEELNIAVSLRARTRTNLALHHLFAACRFGAQVKRVEASHVGEPFGDFWEEILQNALAVATLAVAALESYANQYYADGPIAAEGLNEASVAKVAALVDREDVLTKFDLALTLRTGASLDRSIAVVQNADVLIKLRNAVIHFRPEWHDEEATHAKLSRQLNYRFTASPFLPGEPLFPRAWASASFAAWALRSAVEFMEYFCRECGLPSKLEPFRERLTVLSDGAVRSAQT